jgi:enoyl-CoA hydratase
MGDVLIDIRDGLGLITLNRPKAINALTHDMVRQIAPVLRDWATDEAVRAVVITGAGERGLCAGGDIVAIHRAAKAGRDSGDLAGVAQVALFWREEYILNAAIRRFPKPYVAFMDGIVMGGGVGVSAHGDVRVVTERSMIGMPEVGIGFVPDVGGTYLLAHAPGELGTHVALTTARLSAGDAIACGLADHFVPSEHLPDLLEALRTSAPAAAVARFVGPPPESELLAQQEWIDQCYSAQTVEEIVARLQGCGVPEAAKAAQQILGKSPTALKVALRSLRNARKQTSLEEALNEEYRVSIACLGSADLVEGIRAQVVDKDRSPQWSPPRLEDVSEQDVESYFTPLVGSSERIGAYELGLTPPLEGST